MQNNPKLVVVPLGSAFTAARKEAADRASLAMCITELTVVENKAAEARQLLATALPKSPTDASQRGDRKQMIQRATAAAYVAQQRLGELLAELKVIEQTL